MIQEEATKFATERLLPHSAEWDHKAHFPVDVFKESAQLGFAGIYASEEAGGSGLGRLEAAMIFEALAKGDVSFSAFQSIHNMCNWMIDTFGNEQQKEKYCQRQSTMELIASYCLTEPNSGSDAAAMATFAKKDGDDFVQNGSKCFISGGGVSDLYVVMCRTGENEISTILVEKGTPGLSFGKNEDKMGWKMQPTCMVMFEDCRVPKENVVGTIGDGFKYAMNGLNGGRINIAACSLGGAAFAQEQARNYSLERKQFKKNQSQFQNVQFKLAEMATDQATSRLIVRQAAQIMDSENSAFEDKVLFSAMCKLQATDKCFDVANYALQIHGGYGYLRDYPVERVVRDLRVHQILEGTNEVMRLIISRNVINAGL